MHSILFIIYLLFNRDQKAMEIVSAFLFLNLIKLSNLSKDVVEMQTNLIGI